MLSLRKLVTNGQTDNLIGSGMVGLTKKQRKFV